MAEPYCLALVLCDGFHRDPSTGKFTLLGTFETFAAPSYPAQIRLAIYFAVTDGVGNCGLRVQLVDAKAGIIDANLEGNVQGRVFGIKTDVNFDNPLAVSEHALEIGIVIPHPGVYHCELWANDSMLMQRRLIAKDISDLKEGE